MAQLASDAVFCVSDLAREERVTKLIEEAQKRSRGRLPDNVRKSIRKEVDTALGSLNAYVFESLIKNPGLASSLALSLIRRREDLKFRDGLILASSLSFALDHEVRACLFVTRDTDLVSVASALALPYGVRVLCVDDVDHLARVLETGLKKVQTFDSYVGENEGAVLADVERLKPQAIDMLVTSAQREYPQGVRRAELEAGEWAVRSPLQALPLHPPVEGMECVGDVKLSLDLNAPGYLHMTVAFRGEVSVRYSDGEFSGEPRVRLGVESVSV